MDISGKSDPFVEIKISKGNNKALITSTQDDKEECFWENCGVEALTELTKDDLSILKMYITVYDYDYNSNDLIGKNEYDLSKIVAVNGSWVNERIPLLDEKGFPEKTDIYIQC